MESGRHPLLLGFFLLPSYGANPTTQPLPRFLSVSSEGTELEEGIWGNLDESLCFLDQPVIVVSSCKGFLLCATNQEDNMTYIICNPVTTEFCVLPKTHKAHRCVVIAFICKGDDISLNGRNHYEIVRVGIPNPRELFTTLEMETFSSTSGEWMESTLNFDSPISLVTANLPALVIDDVIYWKTWGCSIVAYDHTRASVEVIEFPVNNLQRPVCWSDKLSVSEGKIHYCISNRLTMDVWMIADIQRREWILRHRVSFREMFQMNPDVVCPSLALIFVQRMHTQNSKLLLLFFFDVPYWYNLENKKLSRIYCRTGSSLFKSLPYEWPSDQFA
ncbi:hypothetical protein BUALT_Bualt08G0059200 [Buddleja alternifolia]|uniref:F-box protein At3g26010-like beta-propeller domain-containing protein n=1 Tax=Buddleja alternifolia TaxID=168488 RepID=A0AAV6XBC5_9LAMI|nr:hypothetical protein BUALT_Bualt08G0059200 [Buddleja alternifolia]